MIITAAQAISRPDLLGPSFSGPSWDRWRAVLKAADAEPLDDAELALFREVAERDPPRVPVRELWAIVGRRGGKDSIASAIVTTAALADYGKYLRPGETPTAMCLACDRDQSRIVHRYVVGNFTSVPLLQPLIVRESDEVLELVNGVEVVVSTNNFRSVRGRTVPCAVLDEAAYWRDERTSNPDFEVYNAILPSLTTLPGSRLVGISSPYRRAGLLFEKFRESYGKDDQEVLVVRGASRLFNPLLPQSIIDKALERDAEAAAAEWLAEFRNDLSDFIDRAVIDRAISPGCFERSPVSEITYRAFTDPSGGSSDSMTLAVAHAASDGRGVLDCIREVRPPFSPDDVVAEFAAVLRSYRISSVVGDRYGGAWVGERFKDHAIGYEASELVKSQIYLEALPLLNSGKIELLDNARLVTQIASLERRTSRGGRDSVDHPVGAHDDIANAALGAITLVAGHSAGLEVWRRIAENAGAFRF